MNRRNFLKTIGGSGIVLAASAAGLTQCDQMPDEVLAAWKNPASDLEMREWVLSYALLAPNPHNMQAWIADLRQADRITLYADKDRLLPHTDPFSRQVMIGQGTFMELLVIAATQKGYTADISLFPKGAPDPSQLDISAVPIAHIDFSKHPVSTPDPLFAEVLNRHSNKQGYTEKRLSTAHMQTLTDSALMKAQSVQLFNNEVDVTPLRDFARDAMMIEIETPRTLRESVVRTRIGADEIRKHRDGIDLHGPLFWWLDAFGAMSDEKAMTPGTMAHQGGIDYALGWANATYSMGVLISPDNTRQDQIAAGRNYVRLNLLATRLGVSMHPVSQVLQEYPEMLALQQKFNTHLSITGTERVQMFFRIGYQTSPSPSPRRPLSDIIHG
jgi:nitroreductase